MRPKKAGPPGLPAKMVEAVPRPVPRMATKVNTWRLRVKGCKSMSSRPNPHQMVSGRTRIRSSGRGVMGGSASQGEWGAGRRPREHAHYVPQGSDVEVLRLRQKAPEPQDDTAFGLSPFVA